MYLDPESADLKTLYEQDNATITLDLAGQVFVLRSAWLSEAEINTEEGNVSVTFQGKSMEMIK
jgi:hypothetical protein